MLHVSSHEGRDGASPSLEVLNVSYIEKKMSFGSVTGTCEPLKPNSWFLVLLPALGQAEGHFLPLTLPGRSLSASALLYKQADHLILNPFLSL